MDKRSFRAFKVLSLLLLLSPFPAAVSGQAEAAASSILSTGEETSIRIEISIEEGKGKWIRSDTVIVRRYPISLEALRAVIEDFEAYPRFVPRLARTTVLFRRGGEATIRQRYEIFILGYRYPTEYELALRSDDSAFPRRWTLAWRLSRSDGSIGESRGSWNLEAVPDPEGRPAVRVTHRNEGLVRRTFPLQLAVMRAVAERELDRAMDAVYQEARRRASAVAGTERNAATDSSE